MKFSFHFEVFSERVKKISCLSDRLSFSIYLRKQATDFSGAWNIFISGINENDARHMRVLQEDVSLQSFMMIHISISTLSWDGKFYGFQTTAIFR